MKLFRYSAPLRSSGEFVAPVGPRSDLVPLATCAERIEVPKKRRARGAHCLLASLAAHLAAPRIERREMEIPASPTLIGYSASWAAMARPLVV